MPARTLGGIARSTQSASLALDFTACDTAVDPRITSVRASNGWCFNRAGVPVPRAANVPRIDYDPVTLACKGLLIEEQRTNLLSYSDQFDNAAWSKLQLSATANAGSAPDGSMGAEKLVPNTNNAEHLVRQNLVGLASGYRASYSLFVKAAEYSIVSLRCLDADNVSNGFFGNVVSATGAYNGSSSGTGSLLSSLAAPAGGTWYRLAVAGSAGGSATKAIVDAFVKAGTNISGSTVFAGDGTSGVLAWLAQFEVGDFATSPIFTTSAAATRAADQLSVSGAAFTAAYNASAWSAVVEFALIAASGTRPVWSMDDGTSSNRVELYCSGSSLKLRVVTGGVQQCDATVGAVAAGTYYKVAVAAHAGAVAATLAGAAEVTAAATLPTVDRLRYGSNQAGDYLCGWLKSHALYPRTLPVHERIALTT